jgi:hypothetical protein
VRLKLMSQMRRGTVEYCVMALLRDRDCHGLELARVLAASGELMSSESTIYPLLRQLRSDGLVETFSRESGQGSVQANRPWPRIAEAVHPALGTVPRCRRSDPRGRMMCCPQVPRAQSRPGADPRGRRLPLP